MFLSHAIAVQWYNVGERRFLHQLTQSKEYHMTEGTKRADIKIGQRVSIVLKQDQRSGKLTEGTVRNILTKSATHRHGIKVRLENGQVGRVKSTHETGQDSENDEKFMS